MKDLQKEEIKVLKRLFELVIHHNDSGLCSHHLPPIQELFESALDFKINFQGGNPLQSKYVKERNIEYLSYFETCKEYGDFYGICKVYFGNDLRNDSVIKEIYPDTKRFLDEGGFQKLYEEQQKDKELKTIKENKLRNETIISDRLKKDYEKNKRRSNLAIGISIFAVILSIFTTFRENIIAFFQWLF